MVKAVLPLVLAGLAFGLAGCDAQVLVDKTSRNMASSVVLPVVARDLVAPQAQAATECILNAASQPEINALSRDYGVEAGSLTKENIRNIALRPAAKSCFAASGIPALRS